jgi:hypothetical protein
MRRKWLSLVLALMLVALAFGAVSAAPEAPDAGVIDYYPTLLPADTTSTDCSTGTPYAIHVSFSGLTAANTYSIKAYHYTTADTTNRGCFWNFQANTWVAIDNTYSNLPTVTGITDWSGWLYIKEVTQHTGKTSTADGLKLRVRFRTGSTNMDATITAGLVAADMSGACTTNCGGWLVETNGFSRAGKAYAVKSGATLVGLYVSEDNGVNEGYPAALAAAAPMAAGYSKVAVPACTTCGYTIESWNLAAPGTSVGQVNTMGDGACPNDVSAGAVTSLDTCTAPTAITLRTLTARAPLSPLAAAPVVGLALAGGWVALRRRRA